MTCTIEKLQYGLRTNRGQRHVTSRTRGHELLVTNGNLRLHYIWVAYWSYSRSTNTVYFPGADRTRKLRNEYGRYIPVGEWRCSEQLVWSCRLVGAVTPVESSRCSPYYPKRIGERQSLWMKGSQPCYKYHLIIVMHLLMFRFPTYL